MKKVNFNFKEISKSGMSMIIGGDVEPLKNDATYVAPKKYYPPVQK